MFHYVVSKMADHHAAYFPIWYAWYRQVYVADKIIILAVKTPRSHTRHTEQFFAKKPGVHIESRSMGYFDDEAVHARLREIVAKDAEMNEECQSQGFTYLQADADEFFQPLPRRCLLPADFLAYHWIEFASESAPEPATLATVPLRALWHTGYKSVLVNRIAHDDVAACGHVYDYEPPLPAALPTCYHWCYTGPDAFVAKAQTTMRLPLPFDWHQSVYRRILDQEGEPALRQAYEDTLAKVARYRPAPWATEAGQECVEWFRSFLTRLSFTATAKAV